MSWLEPLKLAIKLYNDGDSEACVAQINSILTDTLPLYPRMRCHILLGHALENWYEAETARFRAENYLTHWRLNRPAAGTPASARREVLHREIRGLLDDLSEELRSWRPDDWYEHQLFWNDADAEDRDAAITKAIEGWYAEQAEDEEEEDAEQTENDEEDPAGQIEGEAEDIAEQAESEEERIAKQAEGEDEKLAEQVKGEEEAAAEEAECKE